MSCARLGIIGISPGNGHPYSWSAIFNGYEPSIMERCGYPVIPRYLEQQQFPQDTIALAKVTHVWTQEKKLSEHVAQAARIETIVNNFTDMVGKVDGVLLARDDAKNHVQYALPFLEAGIPIYIDKPLALSVKEASYLIEKQQYPGQLFSCSALRYARELQLSQVEKEAIGQLRYLVGRVSKDWDKYAVHVIEPLLLLIGDNVSLDKTQMWRGENVCSLNVSFSNRVQASITTLGEINSPVSIKLYGDSGEKELVFENTFAAFKAALNEFVEGILHRDVRISTDFMLNVVEIIESGRM